MNASSSSCGPMPIAGVWSQRKARSVRLTTTTITPTTARTKPTSAGAREPSSAFRKRDRAGVLENEPMILTYKYRLLPTKRQHTALARILEDQRHLYNAALQERIDCYRKTAKTIGYV